MRQRTAISLLFSSLLFCQQLFGEKLTEQRARPPQWTDEEINVFFEDAREHLVGERPSEQEVKSGEQGAQDEAEGSGVRWSRLIDAETLTAEVKRISNRLNLMLRRVGPFKSGGNQDCQREFAMLTTLLDVIAQHEAESRIKDSAIALRDLCYRATNACDEPTKAAFDVAKQTHAVLGDVLNGMSPPNEELEPAELVLQTLLMQRMEQAIDETLKPNLADEAAFGKAADEIRREAQLLSVLAQVIQHPDSDYGDDDDFLSMARDLLKASQDMAAGVDSEDYPITRSAFGRTTQSCSACHEGYRG